jgi:Trypsin-co-occurring domain 2
MVNDDGATGPSGPAISLDDAVAALIPQLYSAISAATQEGTRLRIADIKMEFSVLATSEQGAAGRVRFWIFDAAAGDRGGRLDGHRVTVRLTPTDDSGHPLRVADAWDEGARP